MGDPQITMGFNTENCLSWMIWGVPPWLGKPVALGVPCIQKNPDHRMYGVGSYGSIFRGMTIHNYEQFWCEQGFWRSFDASPCKNQETFTVHNQHECAEMEHILH